MSRGRKPRAERPEPSREQLMAAAIDCFARLGYQGTTIDRIARDAGVTKGAVYYHFRDKEELLFEAVKDRIGGFEQHVLEKVKVTPAPDALTRLREVVDACFFHATVSNHRRFIMTLMIEALDTNPRLSAEFRDILRRMRTFLTTVVLRGQQKVGKVLAYCFHVSPNRCFLFLCYSLQYPLASRVSCCCLAFSSCAANSK